MSSPFWASLAAVTVDALLEALPEQAALCRFLPRWETETPDLAAAYGRRMADMGRRGYGMFAKYHVFTVADGALVPVKYPDGPAAFPAARL